MTYRLKTIFNEDLNISCSKKSTIFLLYNCLCLVFIDWRTNNVPCPTQMTVLLCQYCYGVYLRNCMSYI